MKKYHKELEKLSAIIRSNNGYRCGHCEECTRIYNYFAKLILKIKVPSQAEIEFDKIDFKPKVDLTKMKCMENRG